MTIHKNTFFLTIYTIVLAVLSLGVVNNTRVIKQETSDHRLRNEAENICQIEIVSSNRPPAEWVSAYKACVDRRSGIPAAKIKN